MTRWISIGKKGENFAEQTRLFLRRMGPYSTREINGEICFGLKISAIKGGTMLTRSKWLNRSSSLPKIEFSDYLPELTIKEIDTSYIEEKMLKSIPPLLNSHEGVKRFERVQRVIHYASLAQLNSVLEDTILPLYFNWYPEGLWCFSTASLDFHLALAVLRVLGTTIELGHRDYDQFKSIGPFKMLTGAQPGGIFNGNKHSSLPLMLFLPVMYGFVASKVSFSYIFLFDEPIDEVREPFPRSGLEFFRSNASQLFSQDFDGSIEEITPINIDTMQLLEPKFQRDQVKEFIDEYYENLEKFLTYILEPANFADINNKWTGLTHYRTILAFERLTDEVIFLLTDDSAYLRKLATFRILDQISSLMTSKSKEQSDLFRKLLIPINTHDPIAGGLGEYSGTIGDHLQKLLEDTREELRSIVLSSIFLPDVYDPSADEVKLPNGDVIAADDYITGVVRELRNTYHGYHTHQFDKYLLISTGNTPDSLASFGVLAYLALIGRPENFLIRDWI